MASQTITETVQLKLRFGAEDVSYTVSSKPPRECTNSEIPIIDLANIEGSSLQRQQIADDVRKAAVSTGFFYIKNHGIREEIIQKAHDQAERFFNQPTEAKAPTSKDRSKYLNNGWSAPRTSRVSPGESLDVREGFGWSYSPNLDPLYQGKNFDANTLALRSQDEEHIWEGTAHLDGFKHDTLAYWRSCLSLARKLLPIWALSLSLPETYFDGLTTFPGADGVFNFYPALNEQQMSQAEVSRDVGLGSHTDLQCFTLLWQDMHGGLQVLNNEGEWVWATPIKDTFVVNIGDFLRRITNDQYKSTVHRAYNRGLDNTDRISMPFFFGFNYDAECSVLPSCIDDQHPAKYEPITCGKWREARFAKARDAVKPPSI